MKKIFLILTILSLVFTGFAFATTVTGNTQTTIRIDPDSTYTFKAEDFSTVFSNIDAGTITSVVITTLPSEAAGYLTINNQKVTTVPQTVTLDEISTLKFVTKEDYKGLTSFDWRGKVGNTTENTLFTTNLLIYSSTTTENNIEILQDQTYTFKESDFTKIFNELGAGNLSSITINQKPESGKFKLNGTTISELPIDIDLKEIPDLTFTPASGFTGTVSIKWVGSVKGQVIPLTYTTNIIVKAISVENITPIDMELTTQMNTAIDDKLKIKENFDVNFVISTYPTHGTIEGFNTKTGEFRYIPERNYTGDDQFTFKATVGENFESNEGTVKITVFTEEVIIPFRYEDMQQHWGNYSASHLAAMNIIIGEKINDEYFFYPDRLITRADFVLYMLSALGINYTDVDETFKFDDDAEIEGWLKPYVYTAYKKGIINGSADNGKLYFNANDNITRAEVATIINNAMNFKYNNTDPLTFSDKRSIPAWATKAIQNMVGYEIINGFEDNSFKPNKTVTKAELSEILYKAVKEKQLELEKEETKTQE